jgi:hypothetical protein
MSHPVTLSAQETSERLIAVLRDYAEKLSALNDKIADANLKLLSVSNTTVALNAARLVCFQQALDKPVSNVTQHASGMLESSDLDQVIWTDLKLRLDEVEEHLRFSRLMVANMVPFLANRPDAANLRALVGRPGKKAPF